MKNKSYKVTKMDVILWELNPLDFGDKVRVIKKGRIGELTGITGWMEDTKMQFWEKVEFAITFKRTIRQYKRWEIKKVIEE